MIPLPRLLTSYAERDLDCQRALEDSFKQVLRLAEQSGWSKTESAKALRELAYAHLFSDAEGYKAVTDIMSADITRH